MYLVLEYLQARPIVLVLEYLEARPNVPSARVPTGQA